MAQNYLNVDKKKFCFTGFAINTTYLEYFKSRVKNVLFIENALHICSESQVNHSFLIDIIKWIKIFINLFIKLLRDLILISIQNFVAMNTLLFVDSLIFYLLMEESIGRAH